MLKKISDLPLYFQANPSFKTLVVAVAQDVMILKAVELVVKQNYCRVILCGDQELIQGMATENGISLEQVVIIDEKDSYLAAVIAIKLIKEKKGDLLLKGAISNNLFLKAVYHKEHGIKASKIISHLAFFEIAGRDKLISLTDSVINISPDLLTKQQIVENSVSFIRRIGQKMPVVAALAAVERINPAMNATLDAGLLARMSQIGQISNCQIDGPTTFDNAMLNSSNENSPDLLLAPDIESASMISRSFLYFAKAKTAAMLLGAKKPIITTTSTDNEETIVNSILLSILTDI